MPAGPMFWGLFVALGAIVVGYIAWMFAVERRDADNRVPREREAKERRS